MKKYLTKFDTHADYLAAKDELLLPNVSLCIQENEVHYNPWTYADEYLTFVAREDGTFQLSRNAVSYSLDNGETWATLTAGTSSPTVAAGEKILWKGELTPSPSYGIGTFSATGNFDVQGNVMSLLYGDNFKGQTDLTGKEYAFFQLFRDNIKVVNTENLSLPATTLSGYCYSQMFYNCTSLAKTPVLPATTLAQGCYNYMFYNCTSMTTAPELPATTLAYSCYSSMFSSCTRLETAPELPATTLANYCYVYMFSNCTSLTTAPILPATTLANNCYESMFAGCTNLNYIKAMFTTTPSTTYTYRWVNGVSSTGTFVKNSAATWTNTGNYAVPNGWTVETANS